MEGVGGLSGNNNSCMMSYGEHNNNNNGFSPMIMMPQIGSSSSHSAETGHNGLFFPPPNTNYHDDPNRTSNAGMILEVRNTATDDNNYNTSTGYYFIDDNNNGNDDEGSCSVKAKIMAHPHYHRLLAAFANCQKIGAPPEVVAKLEEGCASAAAAMGRHVSISLGQDPALDQFMEAYCEMLIKYEEELSKPFEEAMLFLSRIESQFKALDVSLSHPAYPEAMDRNVSSSDDMCVDVDVNRALIDPEAKDREELKGQLLRKYSGHLGGLKQEFMKKRKKGKLPKEARQQLLQWWSSHYKWPYPSEAQKIALAESTGLDQKQINNWFINQRKRHWKPSEDMQFAVVMTDSSAHPLNSNYNYHNVAGNMNNVPFSMDLSPAFL